MASERKERPTQRRLQDARKRGQIARSKDLVDGTVLLATLATMISFGPEFIERLASLLRTGLGRMASGPAPIAAGDITRLAVDSIQSIVTLAGPFALAAAGTAVAVFVMQGGWNVAPEALGFHWDRLSPAHGIKQLGSRAGVDTVKMMIAATALAWLSWNAVSETLAQAVGYSRVSPARAASEGWLHAEKLLRQAVIFLLLMGLGDYLLQRWRHSQSLLMTKDEVKDDNRMLEGNPEVKAKIRRMQRDVARRRMLADIPQASVVITNPTEYAVALQYDRERMAAPRVVAKGKDALAARIRAVAREHEVPIVENVPLAQSLYRSVEIGDFIPAELFGAVAEVLAYLIRLRQVAY